eukprot:3646402-Amphidinium_carterae.1
MGCCRKWCSSFKNRNVHNASCKHVQRTLAVLLFSPCIFALVYDLFPFWEQLQRKDLAWLAAILLACNDSKVHSGRIC